MANSFRSDALNLIGSYSDGCDSDTSDDNEPVTATVEPNILNISSVSIEESDKQQSGKTFDSHVGISDVILQDEVPHVGMDYTIDSDPLDESNCAQIQLIESQVDCGGNDTDASDQQTDEQKWIEKSSVKSDNSASEVHHPNGSDHVVESTVEILSDHTMRLEGNECPETLDDEIQKTPALKEEQTHNEDEQTLSRTSAINETNSSEYVSAPEAQTKAKSDDHNLPARDSTLYVGDDSHQQLSREESSQHHGYYDDEHGYDQQYSNQEQQYEYQRHYNQHQYYEEHVPNHGKEQYDSTAEHQQDYDQIEGTSTSIQDGQQWHIQSDHQHYMNPGHHQHPQLEQQLYLMSNQNQHTNQREYTMSEHHHLQPEQQQHYPQPEHQRDYPQPEQQQHYAQPEHQQDYPQPEQQQHYPQPEHQQDYPQPEQQQHYPQPEQQQHYPQPEHQQDYPQPEQQQHYPQPEQQQHYPQSEHQQDYPQDYPQPEHQQDCPQPEQQQHYPQPEHQQDYPQSELQQYLHPDQQQQYAPPEQQQQQYHGSHPEQQQYTQPEQQLQYTRSEQQQYSQPEQQQQYPQPEQQQQQYSQPEQQQQYPQPEQQQQQYPQPGQQQQQYSHPEQQQQYPQPGQRQQYPQPEQQQYSQYEQQQYPQNDQQYYMQQYYPAQPYPQQPDQQQQSYPRQQQQPDSQLGCTEHSVVQPDQEHYTTSEQQHGEPQGEYSHMYQKAYAQQQYSDPHHNHTHGQHSQSYEHQYYEDSNQYGHGFYLSSHGRTHEQSTQYSYPNREDHEILSFDHRQTANQSGGPNYQPYPSYSDPHPQPFPHFGRNHWEQRRRGSDHERIDPHHGDREDHRPYHHKWGDNYYSTGEQQSNRLPSHPIYGSSASDTCRDPTHSPVKSDGAGHLSDPRLNFDVRNSPQRDYKISGELSDPRRKQRGTKERGRGYEEKHYTRSAKYAKISSTVVSRRPAMLKASNIVKTSEVKSTGPQIIEPHFASTSPPKTKVCDKGDKSKAPGKFPEATTAKKALANFKIPKHKNSKTSLELTTLKPPVKIPALDLPEKSNEECGAEDLPHNTAKVDDVSTEKDITDSQGKFAAQGKETKAAKVSTKATKVLPSNAPAKMLSNLDATTLQALTTIVHQTLKMAANKGMPVAKSITSGMSQLSEMTLSSHSGEMQNITTITPTTTTMAAVPSSATTAVPSTSIASCLSSAASNSAIPSCVTATATPTKGQMISLESQVLGLQNIPAPTVSVALAQEQLASSPLSSAEASSPTPVEMVSLSAPKAEQAPGTEKPDSAVPDTMTNVLAKAKITSTSAPGTRSLPRKTSGIVLATILSDASSQIKGKSTIVPTVVVSNPRVLVPHTMSSCPPLPSVSATVQMTPATDSTQPTLVANSVMVKKSTLFTSKGDCSSEQSVKKIDIDAQAESKKANITHKSPPRLEYFNADLMFKEYNLRQSTASRDGSPLKRLQESVENHGSSCESSKPGKRERSPQSDISSVHKKVKIDEIIGSQENDIGRHDHQPLSSGNPTKNAMHSTKGRSLRRKACVQRRKSWSHQRPQLHGMSQEHTSDDLLCAFCHQRGGAMNLGFLYGPYMFDPVSITNNDHIDANKDSTRDHQRELWVHEDCAVWAPGVCLVGDQLIGLQEAIVDGDHMMCEVCKTSGATLCCTAHGCKSAYHFPCAQETGCTLKGEQFLICCSKHKGTS